jgi:hypothetical protein
MADRIKLAAIAAKRENIIAALAVFIRPSCYIGCLSNNDIDNL